MEWFRSQRAAAILPERDSVSIQVSEWSGFEEEAFAGFDPPIDVSIQVSEWSGFEDLLRLVASGRLICFNPSF